MRLFSIGAQAAVDADGNFCNFVSGFPGSLHDGTPRFCKSALLFAPFCIVLISLAIFFLIVIAGRMLRLSKLGQSCADGRLFPDEFYLLGDSGYALHTWLMVPYPERIGMTDQEVLFNFKHSGSRMIVECAFGRLKGRWRVLNDTQICSPEFAAKVSLACAILHNLCNSRADSAFRASWNLPTEVHAVAAGARGAGAAAQRRDEVAAAVWRTFE